jgi:hypothetical protein
MSGFRRICGQIAVASTALTAFLLPVKFGGIAGLPEAPGFYPPELFDWLIVSWPITLFPFLAGIALIPTLGVVEPRCNPWRVKAFGILWCCGPLLGAWWGLNNSPNGEAAVFGWNHFMHWWGLAAWGECVLLLLAGDPRRRRIFIGALLCGTCVAVLSGWYQYLWGFAETRRYYAELEAAGNVRVGEQLWIKLNDDRVYATFTSCNGFAGFLLLTGALLVAGAVKLGDSFEPRRLSRWIFGVTAAVLTFGLLPLTRSRGALLCALVAALGAFFASRLPKRAKLAAAVGAALVLAAGAWYVHRAGRGFSSGAERLDYLATTAKLVAAHPWTGSGWNGFFREHMRIKTTGTDEAAHDPHNFVAAFAAAGGIPAALIVLAAFVTPFFFIFRNYRAAPPWRKAAAWGVAAFSLHMLMEMDYLVPAGVAAYFLLATSLLVPDEPAPPKDLPKWVRVMLPVYALLLCGVYFIYPVRILRSDLAYARFCAVVVPEPGTRWTPPSPERIDAELAEVDERSLTPSPFPPEKAAECCAALGLPKKARQLLCVSLDRGGERPGVYRKLAELAESAGDAEEAAYCRRKAHALFPAKYPAER